jgi:shikimate kinase
MGSGKSSVGRTVAAMLHLPFVDTDSLVENATGRTIVRIFEESGEVAFRRAETLALQRLLLIPDSVVATGGGAVLRDDNWQYMTAAGFVVRLWVSPEESMRRTEGDSNRPLLAVTDRMEQIRKLHRERDSFYARASACILAERRPLPDIAQEVVDLYEKWRGGL